MKVKLTDVVDRITGNEDRFTTSLQYYLAGEHYDSERIAIYKKGIIQDDLNILGFKFHFPFKSGDTVIMARNPHLKKAGMITYDGICSDASFILRTKDNNVLLGEYLPLLFQNEYFWRWFEANKSGSVNYLLNWKTLKDYIIDLPSIDEQKKIADLMWEIEKTRVAYEHLLSGLDELVKSQFVEMFGIPEFNTHNYTIETISDLCSDVHYGTSSKAGDDGQYICLRMNNITYGGEIDLKDVKYIDLPDKELEGCLVRKGDVLFNRTNSKELVGKTCAFMLETPMVIAGYIIRLRMNGKVTANYLSTYMNLPSSKKLLLSMAKGAVGQANINAQEVKSISVLVPPMDKQLEFEQLLSQTDKSKLAAKQAVESLNALQKSLMRKHLG